MDNEKVGYIYILTNESFNKSNLIKIGYSENVKQRVRGLFNTALPTPFEIYATYEVPKIYDKDPDKFIHCIIQKLNPNLRINANREFFEIEPWDAYDILESMAKMHGRTDKLYQNKHNKYFIDPEIIITNENYKQENLFPQGTYIESLFLKIKNILTNLYPNLIQVVRKNYIAFKNNKRNVLSIWPKANSLEIVLNAKLGKIVDTSNLIYDISNRLWTSAQYAFRFDDATDMDIVIDLIQQTYKLKE